MLFPTRRDHIFDLHFEGIVPDGREIQLRFGRSQDSGRLSLQFLSVLVALAEGPTDSGPTDGIFLFYIAHRLHLQLPFIFQHL